MAVSVGSVKIVDNSQKFLALAEQAKKKALTKVAMKWDQNVVSGVPVDTGYLRNSRGYEVGENEVTVGFEASYSGFVELGTSRQKAQPFLRPSIMDHIDEYKEIIEDAYKNA